MGRTKGNTAEQFPWDRYLSENDEYFEDAISQCIDTLTNSSMVRKAVSTIGISDVSGTKVENCSKLNKEMSVLRKRLSKISDKDTREKARNQLVEHFKAKLISKDSQTNIPIPSRPVIPNLTNDEISEINKKYPSIISPGAKSPKIKPKIVLEEEDEKIPEMNLGADILSDDEISDEMLLEALAVLYYYNSPLQDGKRRISLKGFKDDIISKYKDHISETSVLINNDSQKSVLKSVVLDMSELSDRLTNDRVVLAKTIIDKADKKYGLKERKPKPFVPIIPVIRTPEPVIQSLAPVIQSLAPVIQTVDQVEKPKLAIIPKGKYSKEDFIELINSKGWKVPDIDNREELCDYILENIKIESKISKKEQEVIDEHLNRLQTKLQTTLDMYEDRIKKLEDQINIYEEKNKKFSSEKIEKETAVIEELKEKIEKMKEKIEMAQKEKEIIQDKEKETTQTCFMMNDWLNQKEFELEVAKNSVYCGTDMSCNIDTKLCEKQINEKEFFITKIRDNKLHSKNKELIDIISKKISDNQKKLEKLYKKRPVIMKPGFVSEEISSSEQSDDSSSSDSEPEIINIIPRPIIKKPSSAPEVLIKKPKKKITFEEEELEESQPELLIPTPSLQTSSESQKVSVEEPSQITFESKPEEVLKSIKPPKKKIEFEEELDEILSKDAAEVKTVEEIPSIVSGSNKECFTKEYYNTEQSMIEDLTCPDGEVCDLDMKKCVIVTDKDIIVPITIGDMILNIKGSNNIVETLKQKIRALQPVKEVSSVESKSFEQESEIEEPSVEEEKIVPLIKTKNPTLEEIVEKMRDISGSKSATTSNQQKVKVLQKKALEKLRKCAGI